MPINLWGIEFVKWFFAWAFWQHMFFSDSLILQYLWGTQQEIDGLNDWPNRTPQRFSNNFPHAILQYNSSIQFSDTIHQYKSPIIPQYMFYAFPNPPQLLPVHFLPLLIWSWQLVSKKTVCQLSCQSLRHLHIQTFFPATSKVANPVNFITFLHKGSSP